MKQIGLLLILLSVNILSHAGGKGYFHIFNAGNLDLKISGVKGHKPHWVEGNKKDRIPPNSHATFYVTQKGSDTMNQEFKLQDVDHNGKNVGNPAFVTIQTDNSNYLNKKYSGTEYVDKILKNIDSNYYISLTPLKSGKPGNSFQTVVTVKEINDGPGFNPETNKPIKGSFYYDVSNLTKDDFSWQLIPVSGINTDAFAGLGGRGLKQSFVSGYVWIGYKEGNGRYDPQANIRGFAQGFYNDFYNEFLANYDGTGYYLESSLLSWTKQRYGTESKTDTKQKIMKWYYNLITEKYHTEIQELVKNDKKATSWYNIIVGTGSLLANALDKAADFKDNDKFSSNAVSNAVDIIRGVSVLTKLGDPILPPGSYKDSCKSISYSKDYFLMALCENKNGDEVNANLLYLKCFSDDVGFGVDNKNGELVCAGK